MASGPNSDDIGRATAPIRKMAMNATAVSSEAGLTMATTSPRPTPRPVRTLASRLDCSLTSPNVYVVWVSSLATTTQRGGVLVLLVDADDADVHPLRDVERPEVDLLPQLLVAVDLVQERSP